MFKKIMSIFVAIVGGISSFLALFSFITGMASLSDINNAIMGEGGPRIRIESNDNTWTGVDSSMAVLHIVVMPVERVFYSEMGKPEIYEPRENRPSMHVKIDGKDIGRAPIKSVRVKSGKHTITTETSGYISENVTIEVEPGGPHLIAIPTFANDVNGIVLRQKTFAIEATKSVARIISISVCIAFIAFSIAFFALNKYITRLIYEWTVGSIFGAFISSGLVVLLWDTAEAKTLVILFAVIIPIAIAAPVGKAVYGWFSSTANRR